MALEAEAQFLQQAVRAKLLDPEKGTAALAVYSQLQKMGAKFTFGEFLVERGLISAAAMNALASGQGVQTVSSVGDFELLELLGEGQCGSVFRARQLSLDRSVAVKILNAEFAADPENVRRFQHEARASARFSHPNIVQGIDTGSDQGLHYFAMELVDGGSARDLIEASPGAMAEDLALAIGQHAAAGLTAAHAAGFVHRDVKPDNILIAQDGQAKLADLGISQLISRRAGEEAEFWASPPYVAPEVIGGGVADARSDVYSLGATLYELLAGVPPYPAENPEDIFRLHLSAPVPDIRVQRPDVRYETASLIYQMLAKDPRQRTPSAAVVADAIGKLLQPPPSVVQPSSPKSTKPSSRIGPAVSPAGAGAGRVRIKLPAMKPKAGARVRRPVNRGRYRYKPRRDSR